MHRRLVGFDIVGSCFVPSYLILQLKYFTFAGCIGIAKIYTIYEWIWVLILFSNVRDRLWLQNERIFQRIAIGALWKHGWFCFLPFLFFLRYRFWCSYIPGVFQGNRKEELFYAGCIEFLWKFGVINWLAKEKFFSLR